MATLDDVRALALALPETSEGVRWGEISWAVGKNAFVWERPLNKADRRRLGEDPVPEGPLVAVYVADLDAKDFLVTEEPDVFFTIEHFQGFRAVLIRLDRIDVDRLEEAVTDAWLVRAPKRVAAAYLADRSDGPPDGGPPLA